MILNSVGVYKNLKKFINILEQIIMGLQILTVMLIFLCAAHIILGICNSHALDFLNPFIENLKSFMVFLFGTSIKQNQDGIDGREVLFILFSILVTFVFVQLKMILQSSSKDINIRIEEEKVKTEQKLNKELKQELRNKILSQGSYAMAVQWKIKWISKASLIIMTPPSEEELEKEKLKLIQTFYNRIKSIGGVTFSKAEDTLIISSDNFENIDEVISTVNSIYKELKNQYRKKRYAVRAKLLIDSYDKSLKSVSDAYKNIKALFALNSYDNVLCFGNFKARYEQLKDPRYYLVSVKGKYEIPEGDEYTVWYLVKKN